MTSPTSLRGLNLPTLVSFAVVLLLPLVLLRVLVRPVDDADAFWHILSGQNVWRTHDVVVTDPFGRFSTNPWVQIDWLSDLSMAGAHGVAGLAGVAWLYVVLGLVLFGLLYLLCRREAGITVAGICAATAWAGTYASQGFRPQTVSFVLLVVTLGAWWTVRAGTGRTPWWFVPLTYVWACLHGLWFLGPLVGLTVVAGLLLDRARPLRELLPLAAVPLASVLVAAFTPVGPRLLTAPFTVNSYAGLVTEWRPPDVHEPYVAMTVVLLVVVAVGWARSTRRPTTPEVLLWVMALGWTLLYARTVAVGAVIVAPLAARALAGLVPAPSGDGVARSERGLVALSCFVASVVAGLLLPSVADRPGGVPLALDPQLSALPRGTVVLNDDALGGWLLLDHPDLAPVIDTRTYLFGVPYIEDYIATRAAVGDWPAFVETTGATAALLPRGEPLVQDLPDELGWTLTATGDGYALLQAPGDTG